MHSKNTLLTAALGLLTSVLSVTSYAQAVQAQAGTPPNIQISSLPFAIAAPGTYVLAADLTCPTPQGIAIVIPSNLSGPVILDLKGFTITGGGILSTGVGIGGGFVGPIVSNAFPITVRNGTIKNVSFGVWAESNQLTAVLSGFTIANLALFTIQPPAGNSTCVIFGGYVEKSTVSNCNFNNATYGIQDTLSPGGNLYSNITWNNVGWILFILPAQAAPTGMLKLCEFAAPPSAN